MDESFVVGTNKRNLTNDEVQQTIREVVVHLQLPNHAYLFQSESLFVNFLSHFSLGSLQGLLLRLRFSCLFPPMFIYTYKKAINFNYLFVSLLLFYRRQPTFFIYKEFSKSQGNLNNFFVTNKSDKEFCSSEAIRKMHLFEEKQ